MDWIGKETKRLLKEMSVGIVLYNAVLSILAFFLMRHLGRPVLPVAGGILLGTGSAVLMIVDMGITTERALGSRNESYASQNTILHAILRKVIYIAVLGVFRYVFKISLPAVIIATMGMKAGAYLQPWVRRTFGSDPEES